MHIYYLHTYKSKLLTNGARWSVRRLFLRFSMSINCVWININRHWDKGEVAHSFCVDHRLLAFRPMLLPHENFHPMPRIRIEFFVCFWNGSTWVLFTFFQFKQHVQLVKPKATPSGELWDVTYKDITSGVSQTREYDYVFVCNGHYNTPFIPTIPGLKTFEGLYELNITEKLVKWTLKNSLWNKIFL